MLRQLEEMQAVIHAEALEAAAAAAADRADMSRRLQSLQLGDAEGKMDIDRGAGGEAVIDRQAIVEASVLPFLNTSVGYALLRL